MKSEAGAEYSHVENLEDDFTYLVKTVKCSALIVCVGLIQTKSEALKLHTE